jgi:hypothetical protein
MHTKAIIDNYIQEVANHLPRRLRDDVGMELRDLLTEHLESAARDAEREADSEMAIEVLRRFGRPDEVAARYAPRGFDLIEPELSPWFVKLAGGGIALQWALTLPRVFAAEITLGQWWSRWGTWAFAWIGIVVVWFGVASWIRRRSPVNSVTHLRPWTHYIFWVPLTSDWRPIDREAIERRAAKAAFPIGVVATIFLSAPAWFVGLFASAGADASWAAYDTDFRHWLLLPLLALMVARLVLFAAVTALEHWRAPTESLRFALWAGFVALLYWALFGGNIFANRLTDSLFKAWLFVFLLVNTIQILVWVRRKATRVRVPRSLAELK